MENKPNITPTPWDCSEMKGKEGNAFLAQIWCNRGLSLAVIESRNGEEQGTNNAKAIVTAVNCTYGANINPEKILVTIALFETLYNSIDSCTELTPSLLQECKKALNNIKYKD